MKRTIPAEGKLSKEAKECVQEVNFFPDLWNFLFSVRYGVPTIYNIGSQWEMHIGKSLRLKNVNAKTCYKECCSVHNFVHIK